MNQTLTSDGIDGIILTTTPLPSPNWASGTTNTSITWGSTQPAGITEEQLITLLKEKLKLKIEEFDTNIMISILLDNVEICKDYFMYPQSK